MGGRAAAARVDVERGDDAACPERLDERILVEEAAARRVVQDRVAAATPRTAPPLRRRRRTPGRLPVERGIVEWRPCRSS